MKKTISILLAVVMAVTIWSFPGFGAFATDENPGEAVTSEQAEDMDATEEDTDVDEDVDEDVDVDEDTGDAVEEEEVITQEDLDSEEDVEVMDEPEADAVVEPDRDVSVAAEGDAIKLTSSNTKVTVDHINRDYSGDLDDPADPKPTVKVRYGKNETRLKEGVDYELDWSGNKFGKESKVKVIGIGDYTGSVEKVFYIAKVQGFKVKTGVTKATLKWTEEPNVDGYKIYKYSYSKDEATFLKTVKGGDTVSAEIKGLKAAGVYTFFVRSYVTDEDGNTKYGPLSKKVTKVTGVKKVKLTKASVSKRPNKTIYTKWEKTRCTGYQVQVSKSDSFSKTVRNFKTSKTSRNIKKYLSGGTKYYVRVRAYVKKSGETKYGKWSNIKSATPKSKGWYTDSKGLKYYYSKGNMLKGEHTFTKDNTKFKYYYFDDNGVFRGFSEENWEQVDGCTSNKTRGGHYVFCASRNLCRYVVYKMIDGNWAPYKWGLCGPGRHEFPTPAFNVKACGTLGKWKQEKRLHFGDPDGYRCWYYTRVKNTIGLHSIKYRVGSKTRLREPYYHQLGSTVSHGCIRLSLSDAYWCYQHIWKGARVIVVNDDQKADRSKVTL